MILALSGRSAETVRGYTVSVHSEAFIGHLALPRSIGFSKFPLETAPSAWFLLDL